MGKAKGQLRVRTWTGAASGQCLPAEELCRLRFRGVVRLIRFLLQVQDPPCVILVDGIALLGADVQAIHHVDDQAEPA